MILPAYCMYGHFSFMSCNNDTTTTGKPHHQSTGGFQFISVAPVLSIACLAWLIIHTDWTAAWYTFPLRRRTEILPKARESLFPVTISTTGWNLKNTGQGVDSEIAFLTVHTPHLKHKASPKRRAYKRNEVRARASAMSCHMLSLQLWLPCLLLPSITFAGRQWIYFSHCVVSTL